MSKKRLEQDFHSRLNDYSSKIDEDQLWLDIEDRIPKKEKKRRFFIWLFLGIGLLLSLLLKFSDRTAKQIPSKIEMVDCTSPMQSIDNQKKQSDEVNIYEREAENEIPKLIKEVSVSDTYYARRSKIVWKNEEKGELQDGSTMSGADMIEEKMTSSIAEDEGAIMLGFAEISTRSPQLFPFEKRVLPSQRIQRKRDKPRVKKRKNQSFMDVSYYAGNNGSSLDLEKVEGAINYGEDYFSQGLSLTYKRTFTSNLYWKVGMAYDVSYRKYNDQIQLDTIVESSAGTQILTSIEYGNGVIDTESGIPMVNGVFSREVLNLNTVTTLSLGLGLGYRRTIEKFDVNAEMDVQRSIYQAISGIGRRQSEMRFNALQEQTDYFDNSAKYAWNTHVFGSYPITESLRLCAGFQFQYGMSSLLQEQVSFSERMNLWRASIGIRKNL